MFVDQVEVTLVAGKGGDGCLSFRREKGVPRGGPDGGRGGDGGSIYLVSASHLNTLAYFRFHPLIKAPRGTHGQGSNRQGRRGKDLYLRVPVGTVIREKDTARIVFDFTQPDQEFLAVRGGRGGRGNASFATSTQQAPRFREKGFPGEEKSFVLELKLIADVGLVGFPNVGKSTFISQISAARPQIGDYPFTTLIPHLGVVDVDEVTSFVVADIPGLIEGASQGLGLGSQFLRHVERTKILVHLLDVSPYSGRDPVDEYYIIRKELAAFNPHLVERPHVLVANKIDLLSPEKEEYHRLRRVEKLAQDLRLPFFAISALKNEGLAPLVQELAQMLRKQIEQRKDQSE
ncbi:MAG: GTPase ObgE [Candidatus Aminicenantes bacterium]|nr:MAG: GTPase ObgE [Candidatus Aminicenantes bacterium]